MQHHYHKLPIKFDFITDEEAGSDISLCSEPESIDKHIELLLSTCPGEHSFDKNYGCRIWDMDFERIVSGKKWEEDFVACIREAVQTFEKRIDNIEVFLDIKEVVLEDFVMQTISVKKEVTVHIKARVVSTNKYAIFKYKLFLGPLSTK